MALFIGARPYGQKETFGRDGMARHLKLRSAHVPNQTLQREFLP